MRLSAPVLGVVGGLLAAFAVDMLVLAGYPVAVAYGTPILMAARAFRPATVAVSGTAAVALFSLGAALQRFPPEIWIVHLLVLVVVTYLGGTLAGERGRADRRARDAREAEQMHLQGERRFRALIERSKEAVALLDPDGTVRYASPSAFPVIGYAPEELVGSDAFDLVHPEDVDETRAALTAIVGVDGQSVTTHFRCRHRDGTWRWIEWTGTNLLDEPAVGAIVVNFRDVTAQRRAQADLEAAVRVRDEFLSVAAHELKTPVTTLLASAQLALRRLRDHQQLDPQRLERSLHTFEDQARKLARLVEQLLDVSRIEAGRLRLEREATDVVPLVRSAAAVAQAHTERHTIKLRLPPAPAVAWVDSLRLEQVLTNLLDNAIKYSPHGGDIEVAVQVEGASPAGGGATGSRPRWVEVVVRDHGMGIPEEHLTLIFDRFYQAHTMIHSPGLGLGLHIAGQIVGLHGGRIEAQNAESGGARFVVTLPAAAPDQG